MRKMIAAAALSLTAMAAGTASADEPYPAQPYPDQPYANQPYANQPPAPQDYPDYNVAPPPQPPPQEAPTPPLASGSGQWLYTQQYGWVWMPYGDRYVDVAANGPYAYVYYPASGWVWLSAPWIIHVGPRPFFGRLGPWRFSWFRGPVVRRFGFARPFVPFRGSRAFVPFHGGRSFVPFRGSRSFGPRGAFRGRY
jgi:hypothetical protein